jgi:hypothetical protein
MYYMNVVIMVRLPEISSSDSHSVPYTSCYLTSHFVVMRKPFWLNWSQIVILSYCFICLRCLLVNVVLYVQKLTNTID